LPLLDFLKLPEAKKIKDLDAPSATIKHGEIIKRKDFLKKVYADFYREFRYVAMARGTVVELGSGSGFVKEIYPNIITSDVMPLPNTDMTFSALKMPFDNDAVDAFVMVDVLHHLVDIEKFFREAERTLVKGGRIVMVEPAETLLGIFIYMFVHHEKSSSYSTWKLYDRSGNVLKDGAKPLSCSNPGAPYHIFVLESEYFRKKFPQLRIRSVRFHTPFAYILSGGLSMRQLAPNFTYYFVRFIEWLLSPLNKYLGMFMTVELEKK
jgi:SAM-dependent methyltransferase